MYVPNGGNYIYNLVVNRRVDGNNSPDFVMRYEFIDQDILEYSQMEEKKFKGKIDAFSFESFLGSLNENSKGNITEPCYNDIPSDWNGNNGGGSGGGGIGGGASSGNGYTPRWSGNSTSTLWGSAGTFYYTSGSGGYSGSVEIGMGCFCAPPPAPEQKSSYSNKADNCPKGEMDIAINADYGIFHTACRSFEYESFGLTGTKVAAVKGIEHPVLRTDRCPGIGYVLPQSTYYFTLPSGKPRAQRESAMALERAFKKLDKYFEDDIPCLSNGQSYIGLLSSKLLEFTKKEFTKIGGAASKTPPLGWNGKEHDYETNVGLFVPDC